MVIGQVLSRFGELNRSTIRRTLAAVLFYLCNRVLDSVIYVAYQCLSSQDMFGSAIIRYN